MHIYKMIHWIIERFEMSLWTYSSMCVCERECLKRNWAKNQDTHTSAGIDDIDMYFFSR